MATATAQRARCKFVCESSNSRGTCAGQDLVLRAVYESANPTPEEQRFAQATPTGRLEMTVDNPALDGFFQLGRSYYIDITPAE